MRGVALSCAAVAVAVGGCSLFLSTSGLDEQPSPDGGVMPVSEAGATGDDAASSADATPDAPADAATSDAGLLFCASQSPAPKFCADFEDDAGFLAQWDELFVVPSAAGTITREDGNLVTRLTGAPGCSYSRLQKDFAASGDGMRIAFSMRPKSPWPEDRIFFIASLEGQSSECQIFLHLTPTEARTHQQYGDPQKDDLVKWSTRPAIDVWSRVVVELGAAGVTVGIDGQKVSTQALSAGCGFGTKVVIGLGYHCEGGDSEVRFDDVVVDYP